MVSPIKKMLERCQTAGPIGTKFGTRTHIYQGVDQAKKNNPSSPKGHLKGVWGSHIQKYWKDAKQLDRL